MTQPSTPVPAGQDAALDAHGATLAALEELLQALQDRHGGDVPEWEYCEGVMTALLCTRREVPADEWLAMLFEPGAQAIFGSPAEQTRFMMHWLEREQQLRSALQAPVQALDDERALDPGVLDWRGLLLSLPEPERAKLQDAEAPPAFAQAWAAGFLDAVDHWMDDWAPPRDKEIAAEMREAIAAIGALLHDDSGVPEFNLYDEACAPSVSQARFEAFGAAVWAVYDLYDIARSLGPRQPPAQSDKVGRNDPCPCGSGKKYKKCCGA
ncbi:UPF0149 family protein [Comamonas sp. NLF-1-9]|uniref:YecA/YgfB family protein n=1 Tax=Comamonas sp. NLF-1-9 TaxID=2853163 RepID=UPI001C459D05|nr:UPF0149 family protein [Comamonas sp. NLF-1-9]QXL83359.1 UPF0149 family protein [Comamonas sp. NLF-1-9]